MAHPTEQLNILFKHMEIIFFQHNIFIDYFGLSLREPRSHSLPSPAMSPPLSPPPYHSILITMLRALLMGSFFRLLLLEVSGYGFSQKLFMSLLLNYVTIIIYTSAKVVSSTFTVSGSMEPGPLHGFWQQQGPGMSVYVVSSISTDPLPGLQWQHRL